MNEEPRQSRLVLIITAVVAVVAVFLVILLAVSDTERNRSVSNAVVDRVAPDIAGATLDGGSFDLADHRGQWVVVNFFASWCVGCRVEHPELVEFWERHAAVGDAVVVSVVFDDRVSEVTDFFASQGGGWPVVITDTGPVAINYGVTAPPETYIVSPSGRVVAKLIGASRVTADFLDSIIGA